LTHLASDHGGRCAPCINLTAVPSQQLLRKTHPTKNFSQQLLMGYKAHPQSMKRFSGAGVHARPAVRTGETPVPPEKLFATESGRPQPTPSFAHDTGKQPDKAMKTGANTV